MLMRSLAVWFVSAAVMLGLAVFTQDMPVSLDALAAALLLAAPLGMSTWLGALGTAGRLEWPNGSFVVLGLWSTTMAPSFVVDNPDARFIYDYSDDALWAGRWLFFLWCFVFLLVRGRVESKRVVVEPGFLDFTATVLPSLLAVMVLVATGQFSDYNRGAAGAYEAGGLISVMLSIAQLMVLPPILLMVALRAPGRRVRQLATVLFVLSWALLFLSGGRRPVLYAAGTCFFVARATGLRFKPSVALLVAAVLPLFFFLMFTYRNMLSASGTATASLSEYVNVAVDSTSQVVAANEAARAEAVSGFATNTKERFWYGPQFFAVVDLWLDEGVEFQGTFLAGIIASLPSWLFPEKNEWATPYLLEEFLASTGRLPRTDLGPSAWLQFLFELGIPGIILGAVLWGWIARQAEARTSKTRSLQEQLFWTGVLAALGASEQTADAFVVGVRHLAALLVCTLALGFVLKRLFGSVPMDRAQVPPNHNNVVALPPLRFDEPPSA